MQTEHFTIRDGQLVVLEADLTPDDAASFTQFIRPFLPERTAFILLRPGAKLGVLNEQQMLDLGWVRKAGT